jgi:multidrug efflux pump subunit AcrA (membrane-fusion protein)
VRAEQTPPDGKEADAAVLQEQASVEVAAIIYSYTQVTAPFNGE